MPPAAEIGCVRHIALVSRVEVSMSVTVCPNCGRQVVEGSQFCSHCGQAISQPQEQTPERPAGSRPARTVPIVPLAILGAGALALVLVLVLVRSNPPAGDVLSEAPEPGPTVPAPGPTTPAIVVAPAPNPPQGVAVPPAAPTIVAVAPTAAAREAAPRATPTPPIEQVYECRMGAIFGVDPEETLVTINGRLIGTADDWDDAGGGKKYEFTGPGVYFVKLSLAGYRTKWIKIVVRRLAEEEYADVDLELKKLGEE